MRTDKDNQDKDKEADKDHKTRDKEQEQGGERRRCTLVSGVLQSSSPPSPKLCNTHRISIIVLNSTAGVGISI